MGQNVDHMCSMLKKKSVLELTFERKAGTLFAVKQNWLGIFVVVILSHVPENMSMVEKNCNRSSLVQ